MKKFAVLLLKVGVLLSLVGMVVQCGPAPTPTPVPVVGTPTPVPATPSVPPKPVTLTMWTGLPELEPYISACAEDYKEEHPNVTVEVLSTDLREDEAKIAAAIPTDTGPDIFDVAVYSAMPFIEQGLLEPNPPDVDAYVKANWTDFMVNYLSFDGKTYGVPMMEGCKAALFYNKRMFREAGLDPEKPPQTFEEVLEYAQKLAKYDEAGKLVVSGHSLRLSGGGAGIGNKFNFVLHNAGGDIIVQTPEGKWHNGYDNEAGRMALKYYIDSVLKYHVDDPEVKHDADAFVTEVTAMFLREAWVIGEIKAKNPDLEYGVAPMPAWERWDTLAQPWPLYVSRTAEQEEAWDFVKFLTSKENGERVMTMTGWLAAREDVDWDAMIAETPQFETFLRPPAELGYYVEPPIVPFDELETRLSERLGLAYLDQTLVDNPEGIAQAIHEMAMETDEILKKAGLYGE